MIIVIVNFFWEKKMCSINCSGGCIECAPEEHEKECQSRSYCDGHCYKTKQIIIHIEGDIKNASN